MGWGGGWRREGVGRYERRWVQKKTHRIEQTCNSCMFPVMLTCCFYAICVKQSLSPPEVWRKIIFRNLNLVLKCHRVCEFLEETVFYLIRFLLLLLFLSAKHPLAIVIRDNLAVPPPQ